jgi:hypothetical protein
VCSLTFDEGKKWTAIKQNNFIFFQSPQIPSKVISNNLLGATLFSGLNSKEPASIFTGYYCIAFLFLDKKKSLAGLK